MIEWKETMTESFEMVVGLEVHVQLATKTKLFCACSNDGFGAPPNSRVCPVCTGQPGALPVLNKKAVELAFKAALALNGKLAHKSIFARKNYFYPDLPKAYQISQYDEPFCLGGEVPLRLKDGKTKIVELARIHMEEDAGKLLHAIGSQALNYSLVDFNRGGVPLIEIVSKPEIFSSDEAYAYLSSLKEILQYAGVSNCDMEKGEMRCDANISLRPKGSKKLGTRAEIKNLNSFKNVKDALEYEFLRQADVLSSGGKIIQETRLWNGKETVSMRSKEEAHDYRYFPDPDLVPIDITPEWSDKIKSEIPELPQARRERFVSDYHLSPYEAEVLVSDRVISDYFIQVLKSSEAQNDAEVLAKLIMNIPDFTPIAPEQMASLVALCRQKTITINQAKELYPEILKSKKDPKILVEEKGLAQVLDEKILRDWVQEALASNPKAILDIKGGKKQAAGALVGAVMKLSKGKANPALVNKLIFEGIDKA